jgi:hypothetical protein
VTSAAPKRDTAQRHRGHSDARSCRSRGVAAAGARALSRLEVCPRGYVGWAPLAQDRRRRPSHAPHTGLQHHCRSCVPPAHRPTTRTNPNGQNVFAANGLGPPIERSACTVASKISTSTQGPSTHRGNGRVSPLPRDASQALTRTAASPDASARLCGHRIQWVPLREDPHKPRPRAMRSSRPAAGSAMPGFRAGTAPLWVISSHSRRLLRGGGRARSADRRGCPRTMSAARQP